MPPDLRSNWGRCGGKQATNRLSYGPVLMNEANMSWGKKRKWKNEGRADRG
jgi:hypothetical protein